MNAIEEKCLKKVSTHRSKENHCQSNLESKAVYGSKDHPDDELHKRVTSIDNKISIATVYRTVKLFEELVY